MASIKKVMKSGLVALAVAIFLIGCGDDTPPIEVETSQSTSEVIGFLHTKYLVEIRSIVDSIVIKKVTINRGKCGTIEKETILEFGEVLKKQIGDYSEPISYSLPSNGSGCSTSDVKEVQVVTDKGTWTFNF